MLIPLRFSVKTIRERVFDFDLGIDYVPEYKVEIEMYDSEAVEPIVRGYKLLRAIESPSEGFGYMTKRVLEPGPLSEDHRAYLLELRNAIDGLLESGWRDTK